MVTQDQFSFSLFNILQQYTSVIILDIFGPLHICLPISKYIPPNTSLKHHTTYLYPAIPNL